MKRFILFLCSLAFIGMFGLMGLAFYGWHLHHSPASLEEDKIVVIEKGTGVGAITQQLTKEGLLAHPLLFRISTRLTGDDARLHAGEYLMPKDASPAEIQRLLSEGKVIQRQITLREGLTVHQIANILLGEEELDGEIDNLPEEGRLLPDTYSYTGGESRQAVLARMEAAMTATLEELWPERADNLPFDTLEEALILASIVEKETGVPSERARIAGAFINRLRQGMALQTDPTVIYALTDGKPKDGGMGPLGRRLLKKDLTYDSPYNTYLYAGLPPGPICNPGRAAIEATLNPEENDYLYFVADGTGGHAFAKTLAEHNRNVAEWRKIRKASGQ